jgi:hypothetical protein
VQELMTSILFPSIVVSRRDWKISHQMKLPTSAIPIPTYSAVAVSALLIIVDTSNVAPLEQSSQGVHVVYSRNPISVRM